jgi:tRNA G10  N-methylase Trm11
MSEYISSFTTGFGNIVKRKLPSVLEGADVICVYDGMIHYRYAGAPQEVGDVPFFNNSFHVVGFFNNNSITFSKMISDVSSVKSRYIKRNGSFRVRFMRGNQFVKIDKRLSLMAEAAITQSTNLKIDRLNPSAELWYVIRNEGYGFYGQLLKKREITEKKLNKGELRPEVAHLMCSFADLTAQSTVMDPFAGFGAIPLQIMEHFPFQRLLISDSDEEKVEKLKQLFPECDSGYRISCADALNLEDTADNSVDYIITDPPWGFYDELGDIVLFYRDMLKVMKRIIKESGTIILLSARKEEFVMSIRGLNLFVITETINTLVNGKKASVYLLHPLIN